MSHMVARPFRLVAALLVAGALFSGVVTAAQAGGESPTVVELFTSQGCNACPPADAYLGDLAQRDDVLALSLHIDYWDYLGWKDTFASSETTERQRAYSRALGKRQVYTPQMVIGGMSEAVGSRRQRVEREIERVRQAGASRIPVAVAVEEGRVVVRIGPGEANDQATVWLVRYDRQLEVPIARGENAGEDLTYYNVVRDIAPVGTWQGEAVEISLPIAALRQGGRDACAILVQERGFGPIIGAARIALDGS